MCPDVKLIARILSVKRLYGRYIRHLVPITGHTSEFPNFDMVRDWNRYACSIGVFNRPVNYRSLTTECLRLEFLRWASAVWASKRDSLLERQSIAFSWRQKKVFGVLNHQSSKVRLAPRVSLFLESRMSSLLFGKLLSDWKTASHHNWDLDLNIKVQALKVCPLSLQHWLLPCLRITSFASSPFEHCTILRHEYPIPYICCFCSACVATVETSEEVCTRLAFVIIQVASKQDKPVIWLNQESAEQAFQKWKAEIEAERSEGHEIKTFLTKIQVPGMPFCLSCCELVCTGKTVADRLSWRYVTMLRTIFIVSQLRMSGPSWSDETLSKTASCNLEALHVWKSHLTYWLPVFAAKQYCVLLQEFDEEFRSMVVPNCDAQSCFHPHHSLRTVSLHLILGHLLYMLIWHSSESLLGCWSFCRQLLCDDCSAQKLSHMELVFSAFVESETYQKDADLFYYCKGLARELNAFQAFVESMFKPKLFRWRIYASLKKSCARVLKVRIEAHFSLLSVSGCQPPGVELETSDSSHWVSVMDQTAVLGEPDTHLSVGAESS